MSAIKTAVFPVAGHGTRFLPATKSIPKELLPIVDRPLVQYAVDEAREAGIENLIFVTGRGKGAIEDHFDVSYELEETLKSRNKVAELEELRKLRPEPGQVAYVRQMEPLGLGHAVWCARHLIENQPFAVLLADEFILSDRPPLAEMIDLHEQHGGNVVLVDEVPDESTSKYGIIEPGDETGNAISVTSVVEKPDVANAPSNLAIIGRYILDPSIMGILGSTTKGAGGEIQLTDALLASIGSIPFHALRMTGERYDCGSKLGFIEATLHLALRREDLGPDVQVMIDGLART
ncbi:MAG: UTP--glucose-1-phosphate uridylyltransferase GalU [Acidimicrobiia bacterium]|nr:MAG: UTP--glucose-1-phosphate uridylyltransferase GalU [Acidimicrobiia bacterium]